MRHNYQEGFSKHIHEFQSYLDTTSKENVSIIVPVAVVNEADVKIAKSVLKGIVSQYNIEQTDFDYLMKALTYYHYHHFQVGNVATAEPDFFRIRDNELIVPKYNADSVNALPEKIGFCTNWKAKSIARLAFEVPDVSEEELELIQNCLFAVSFKYEMPQDWELVQCVYLILSAQMYASITV